MNSFSSVTMVGRLTRDAELKNTASDTSLIRFTLAIDRRKKDGTEWVQDTSFIDVVFFGQSARNIVQYLQKGVMVGVVGELSQRKWESQDGTKNSKIEVIASNVHLIESKSMRETRTSAPVQYSEKPAPAQMPPMSEPSPDDFEDSDVPF